MYSETTPPVPEKATPDGPRRRYMPDRKKATAAGPALLRLDLVEGRRQERFARQVGVVVDLWRDGPVDPDVLEHQRSHSAGLAGTPQPLILAEVGGRVIR